MERENSGTKYFTEKADRIQTKKKRFKKENDRDDMKIYANDEKSEICKKKN